VRLVQHQGTVEDLTAQGGDEALADRVHPRRPHGGAHDGGAGGLETASKEAVKFDPWSRIRNRKSPNRSPTSRGEVAGLLAPSTRPSGGR
jgi:hypothetical protein